MVTLDVPTIPWATLLITVFGQLAVLHQPARELQSPDRGVRIATIGMGLEVLTQRAKLGHFLHGEAHLQCGTADSLRGYALIMGLRMRK
jgi:hypothetical protein